MKPIKGQMLSLSPPPQPAGAPASLGSCLLGPPQPGGRARAAALLLLRLARRQLARLALQLRQLLRLLLLQLARASGETGNLSGRNHAA